MNCSFPIFITPTPDPTIPVIVSPVWIDPPPIGGTDHSYFDSLIQRSDLFKAYSLRPSVGSNISSPYYNNQLEGPALGGYAVSNGTKWVTYNPTHDTDPRRQDAAKVTIPTWNPTVFGVVSIALNSSTESLTISNPVVPLNSAMSNSVALKIDNEVVKVVRPAGSTITDTVQILRGQNGTTPASHSAGASVYRGTTSLLNILKLPINSIEGHSYLITWDAWLGAEFDQDLSGLGTYKHYQIGTHNTRWLEVRSRFAIANSANSGVATVDARGYLNGRTWADAFGPSVPVGQDGTLPAVGTFAVQPETWTRYWLWVDHRANNYDLVSLWAADVNQNPTQLLSNLELQLYPFNIDKFWMEFNTSFNLIPSTRIDLTAYIRNFVVLKDTPNPTSIFQRPV